MNFGSFCGLVDVELESLKPWYTENTGKKLNITDTDIVERVGQAENNGFERL